MISETEKTSFELINEILLALSNQLRVGRIFCDLDKLVRLIKMCLTETYSRVRVGKKLSDRFPIRNGLKQGGALSPLLFNFALDYVIRMVQVNQDGLKLNGTHELLVYADDVNILGGSVHTVKKNAETLVAAKEIGLEVNADKTKYMVVSRDQRAGRNHSLKIVNPFKVWKSSNNWEQH